MGRSEAGGVQGGRGNFYPTFQLQSMHAGQQALLKSPALIVNHPRFNPYILYQRFVDTHCTAAAAVVGRRSSTSYY